MTFHIITLFPESLGSYVNESIIGRAQKEGHIKIVYYNPRDYAKLSAKFSDSKDLQKKMKKGFTPYKRVDDKPYGGGPGMVMQAEPLIKAVDAALKTISKKTASSKIKTIFLTPSGRQFTNEYARKAAQKFDHVIIICGRYEGMDARVRKIFKAEEISVGPFVLTGGELGAMIIIDAMARQIEGVLGDYNSLEESRTAGSEVYTRPETLIHKGKKYRVPPVLLSGDRAKIEVWKKNSHK